MIKPESKEQLHGLMVCTLFACLSWSSSACHDNELRGVNLCWVSVVRNLVCLFLLVLECLSNNVSGMVVDMVKDCTPW